MLWPNSGLRLAVQHECGDRKQRFGELADDGDRVEAAAHVERLDAPALEGKQREDRHDRVGCRHEKQRASPIPGEIDPDPAEKAQPVESEQEGKGLTKLDRSCDRKQM